MRLKEGGLIGVIFGYPAAELPYHVWDLDHFKNLSALKKSPKGQKLFSRQLCSWDMDTQQDLASQVQLLHMEPEVIGTKKQGQWRILSGGKLQGDKTIQVP